MQGPRAAGGSARRSARVRLARAARTAALEVPGVARVGSEPRPERTTFDRGEPVEGVVAAAGAGGRYEITLYLVAEPVPLRELAEHVRAAVVAAARRESLTSELGSVDVVVEDLAERAVRA